MGDAYVFRLPLGLAPGTYQLAAQIESERDTVTLQVAATAAPGTYDLRLGFYDPRTGGQRLSLYQPNRQALPYSQATLGQIVIQ